MLLRWGLREHRGADKKECCEKTFHKRPSFRLTPSSASSGLGSARLWRVGDRILRSRTLELFDSSRYASSQTEFVAVEYGDQHATSVRSPERRRSTHQLCALLSTMVKIETIKNGPYIVSGEVEVIDADGNKFPVEKRMALCRCGASTEKPFCDGTHSKVGFKAAEKAVPDSKE